MDKYMTFYRESLYNLNSNKIYYENIINIYVKIIRWKTMRPQRF